MSGNEKLFVAVISVDFGVFEFIKMKKVQPPVQAVVQETAPPIVVEAPPQVNIETEGSGRFEYQDGTVYQGQWKLVNEVKVKHGHGTVVIASTLTQDTSQKEEYTGEWFEDKMQGQGTYKYKSGAEYSGSWLDNKHHGIGRYTFDDGQIYEGEWVNHKMHGDGIFIDKEGNKWEGIFVDGTFQSKMQKQLKMEKMLKQKENEIQENSLTFFHKFQEAFAKSDKKTMKENMLPFFATSEDIKLYVKEPFPKFEDRAPEKWSDSIKWVSEYTSINILRSASQAHILDPLQILATQFSGIGQIVEIQREVAPRLVKLVICNAFESSWVIVYYHDSTEAEVQVKKK